MASEICCIFKIGKERFMLDFYNKGEMYFNCVEWFSKKDKEQKERFDTLEGADWIEKINRFKIRNDKKKELIFSVDGSGNFNLSRAYHVVHGDLNKGNIYCCTAIKCNEKDNFKKLDRRFKEFGDVLIRINDPMEFKKRLDAEMKRKNLNFLFNLVSYYDPYNSSKKLGIFDKKEALSYQSELRI